MSSPTLASLVNDNPDAARILERHQLDYCCGGRKTLDDACAEAGVDSAAVLAELEAQPEAPADWATMSLTELVDHLESTHHVYLHAELPRIDALAAKVLDVHGGRRAELAEVASTYSELHTELDPHLMKEEQVLFPMIRELDAADAAPSFHCGSLSNPIRMMLFEHDRAGELLANLRSLTSDYTPPADACASYQALYSALAQLEADTHLHIHKENNLLFPAVVAREADLQSRAS